MFKQGFLEELRYYIRL